MGQYGWLRNVRTLISSSVVKHSYPCLSGRHWTISQFLYGFQNWTENNHPLPTFQKERGVNMLPLHQAVLLLSRWIMIYCTGVPTLLDKRCNKRGYLLFCLAHHYLLHWLTLRLELYSPHSQCGALPVKLKPTLYIDTRPRFELRTSGSNADVLLITPPGIVRFVRESNP